MEHRNRQKEGAELCEKKLSILHEISSFLVVTDDVTSIANLMLDLAITHTNAEKGSLMIVNELGELYIRAAKGIDIQLFHSFRERIGEGIAGTVAQQKIPVLVRDINEDERFRDRKRDRYRTKSFISCPLMYKKRLLGVLNINDKKDASVFTEEEFTLIKIISNQAAIVLENAFLMNQLRAKASGLEEINRKLVEFDIARTEFLTRVSHELRTPLNSIKGSVYYLHQTLKPLSGEHGEFCDIISHETNKLISISENLLDFLRHENESQTVKKAVLNLPGLIQDVLSSKFLKATLAKQGVELRLEIKRDISNVLGDRIRVFQFFVNLIEGLSHYLEHGDVITMTLDENDYVEIHVSVPRRLPEAVYQCIWNSTYIFQGNRSEERIKLYLAWKAAEMHKWKLFAENMEDSFQISVSIPNCAKIKVEAVLSTTMDMFTEFITELLNVNICSIMLADELTGDLTIRSARGLSEEIINRTRVTSSESISGWVALEGKPLLIRDVDDTPHFMRHNPHQYQMNSLLSLPLKIDDKVVGVINLNNKKTGTPFTKQDLYLATSLSERIACFMKKLYTSEYSEDYFRHFITAFESLLNAERNYVKKHNMLPNLMDRLISNLDASEDEKQTAIYVSLIYDLGLALVENADLQERKLSPSEAGVLRVHPYTTIGLLDDFEFSEDVKKAILHHHERYDGTGYPEGLKGGEIPFLARVLAVVDSYCALITGKPYRKAFTQDAALEEIRKGAGSLYDPKIVEALEKAMAEVSTPAMERP